MNNNGVLNRKISLFDNAKTTINPQHLTINELLTNIQTGFYAKQVNKARELLGKSQKLYDDYKQNSIAGFTLSAYCNHRQKTDGLFDNKLNYHTGILQIDIDKLPTERLPEIKSIVKNDKHTLFCFVSLGGHGIKVGMLIDDNVNKHLESFKQAEKYYKETYNIEIDTTVKDIFRLCFVSYDTELFKNPDAEKFVIQEQQKPIVKNQDTAKLQKPKSPLSSIDTTDRKSKYAEQGISNAKNKVNKSIKGNRHNARCKAGYLLGGYVAGGFFTKEYAMSEIQSTVLRNTDLHIEQAMKAISDGIDAGIKEPITFDNLEKGRKDYLQQKYGNTWHIADSKNLQVVNNETGEISELPYCFWYEIEGRNKEITLKIEYTKLYDYLKEIGIRKLILDDKGLKRVLVRITDNVVSEIDIPGLRNLIHNFIDTLPVNITENKTKNELQELIGKGINVYISDEKIDYYIPFERIEFQQDTKDAAFFFFKNGFIEVSKEEIKLNPYNKLRGYIWKSQIIEHNYEIIPENEISKIDSFDFAKFIENICSFKEPEKKLDIERYESLISTIGYLLHNYKTTANKFAVILTESSIDEESQGRTGKGLLLQSINKLRKVTLIDGKNFSFDSQFAFQTVELDTQILFFDDVQKSFNFQRLFSAITEGLSFERKHKDRINLSAEKSPKIVISTNFAIQGNSESDKGRKYEMELLRYYNAKFTPVNEFGTEFFHTWNTEQWNLFYNFMLNCNQTYLQNQCSIPNYSSKTIDEKKLLNATNKEFIEYADTLQRNTCLPIKETYENYLEYAGIDTKDFSKKRFSTSLKFYCELLNLDFKTESHFTDNNEGKKKTIRHYIIQQEIKNNQLY